MCSLWFRCLSVFPFLTVHFEELKLHIIATRKSFRTILLRYKSSREDVSLLKNNAHLIGFLRNLGNSISCSCWWCFLTLEICIYSITWQWWFWWYAVSLAWKILVLWSEVFWETNHRPAALMSRSLIFSTTMAFLLLRLEYDLRFRNKYFESSWV